MASIPKIDEILPTGVELYSEQDAETKVIVPTLERLGYEESDEEKNVEFRFEHPITVNQGTETKTISADIVIFAQGSPVIVVDSKNPRSYLTENDREQVISYARLLESIAPYSILSNGHTWEVYNSFDKQRIKGVPRYSDLLSDVQEQQISSRRRKNIIEQATRTLFAIDSARELSKLMQRCHDVIRNLKGYDPTKAFDELSKLLFAKMYEEREIEAGRRDFNRFTTDAVSQMRDQNVEIIQVLWEETVQSDRYREVFSEEDSDAEVDLPTEAIDRIVELLEDRSLGATNLDVKGIAFEEFLATTYRGGGLGQFFTPREAVNFMVDLVDPAIGENVVDPACGTGGFLIRVYDVLKDKIENSELSEAEKEEKLRNLSTSGLAGIYWETRAARTCKMNMIIHGDGHSGVYQANSLDIEEVEEKVEERQKNNPEAPAIEEEGFDIVLANPPFGARDRLNRILNEFELGRGETSEKRVVLMLERCIRLLKPGGRMAIVLPEGILSNKNDDGVREYIMDHCIVEGVIRLPQDAFKMSEGASCTSILYARKKDDAEEEQGDIFFARAEYIGISPSGQPIDKNDLPAIKENFRQFRKGEWEGIEMKHEGGDEVTFIREAPEDDDLWIEPEVNRTSLLYDRLSYVLKDSKVDNRFSYTYFHPSYFEVIKTIEGIPVEEVKLKNLCEGRYPKRGKKPSMETAEGIPILKVRNITGRGIDTNTEYAPDEEDVISSNEKGIVKKGDLLIASTGEGSIGKVDVYPYEDISFADNHVTICRFKENVYPEYVREFLQSRYGQIQILRHVSGSTGQTEFLYTHAKELRIPLPEKEKQEEIVEMMSSARDEASQYLKEARKLEEKSANTLARARSDMMEQLGNKQADLDL